jgi:hypothetical protein
MTITEATIRLDALNTLTVDCGYFEAVFIKGGSYESPYIQILREGEELGLVTVDTTVPMGKVKVKSFT